MPQLQFVDYILDNIHGYIGLTEIVSQIEKLQIFRRLRDIKQLGLTNWVFPGAEHTRYSHSLGVMHIADKMAERLSFSAAERQLIRIAGLLHDLGHNPLSHVAERAYKQFYDTKQTTIYQQSDTNFSYDLAKYCSKLKQEDETNPQYIAHTIVKKSHNPFHHENIGERVIRNSNPLCNLLAKYDIDVDDVCDIITGDIAKPHLIKFVQILHSELDADRIDYLLRDTFSSGTAYGAFEINTLIKNLEIAKHATYGVDIIGVNSKGIMSADQFLINRYFAYTQVFYHKYVTILGYMSQHIISWMLSTNQNIFPNAETLLKWIDNQDSDESYFHFTDRFFLDSIRNHGFSTNNCPSAILQMIQHLDQFTIPDITEPAALHNVIISGKSNKQLLNSIDSLQLITQKIGANQILKIDETYLTQHVHLHNFQRVFRDKHKDFGIQLSEDECLMHRLINGIAVIQNQNNICLLTDSYASLVKDMCRHRTLFFRTYSLSSL